MRIIIAGFLLLFVFPTLPLFAQQSWKVEKLDPKSLPKNLFTDQRAKPGNGIPDGRIGVGAANSTIKKAWYALPTKRYGHGALGDKIEGGSLTIIDRFGAQYSYQISELEVFEDLTPRLADLDGDGKTEVIAITSHVLHGASISIFQLNGSALVRIAQSKSIGRRFRWLNIAGIARFSGRSAPEIAVVITPHIGGRLKFYKFKGGTLSKTSAINGFSNHVFGSTEQRLSANFPVNTKGRRNLALPSAERNTLFIVAIRPTGLTITDRIKLPGQINKAIIVEGDGNSPKFTVGLSDGKVYSITRRK